MIASAIVILFIPCEIRRCRHAERPCHIVIIDMCHEIRCIHDFRFPFLVFSAFRLAAYRGGVSAENFDKK